MKKGQNEMVVVHVQGINIAPSYPAGGRGGGKTYLLDSIHGERLERVNMYRRRKRDVMRF